MSKADDIAVVRSLTNRKKKNELPDGKARDIAVVRELTNRPAKATTSTARTDITPVRTTEKAVAQSIISNKGSQTTPNLNINAFGANADAHKQTGNMLSAAATGFIAPIVEAGAQTSNAQLTIGEQARLALEGKTTEADRQAAEREKKTASKKNLFAKSDALAQKSAEQTELAKEGKGKVGQFMVDLGIAGTQLLGDVALSAAVPGLGTLAMGTRAFGGAAKEARDAGASENQQQLYGLANMAVSLGVEKLFQVGNVFKKAYGGGVADDVFEKLAGKLLKNPAGQSILAGFLSEGSEEAIEAALSPLLQRIYDNNAIKQFDSKEAWTEYGSDILYSFLLGGTLGAVGGAGNVNAPVETTTEAKNTPVTPKITENDQKVIDKLVADLIAEAEKDGKKLTNKEKNKLYDSVVEDMDKGRISIDTIEEVLGGDTYKSYRETVDSEDALTKEFEELGNKQNATLAEQSRYNELKQQIEDMKKNSQRDTLKTKLSEEVFGIAKDSRLAESYAERDRRGQAYEADLTQYDEKQKATIQNAINSGILNNTRRTHEFVDLIAKISADKGVPFDFTNNEKLKGSSFAVDGKTVNGYVTKDGVTLNIDSAKALNSVVGHEITHVLEGTELYAELQTAVMEYAKSKGDYQSRYDALTKLYDGVEGADVNAELTADLVGDYLFTDEKFIKNLAANKTVFQKIYDEIKYLCKVATAGSKEARQLEKVKRAFEKAYQENGKAQSETKQADEGNVWSAIVGTKKAAEDGSTKYSISETTDGRFVAVVDNDILANIDTSVWDNTKKEAAKKAATEALKQFKDGIVVDGITRKVNRRSRREYTRSKDTEKLFNQKTDVFADKMRAAGVADDIVVVATDWNRDGYLKHPRMDNFVDFDHGKTLIVSGDAKYSAEVVVGITDAGEAVFYDVVDMTPTAFDIKKEELPTTATTQNAIGDIQGSSFDASVSQSGDDVKRSISDSDYLYAEHPVYGNYNVYGEDVAIAPVGISKTETTTKPVRNEVADDFAPTLDDQRIASLSDADAPPPRSAQPMANEGESKKSPRKTLHQGIIENIKASFEEKGFDFDKVLKTAKNLSTFSTVDNTPQRVMEKALGYKEGQILSDITVNRVAQNETEGIKWLNSFTDRKNGLLAQISKQYNIKPGSKESAAAQMYAEGFYVGENNDIIAYGDAELAKDFPDAKVQANIKGLAGDQRIRQIYDETLAAINESRTRNAYPEIPRLDNYFLHFRAMDDTFSRLGLPFNLNDIRAKDLPTDLNGVTADLKPGQPYFASAMHRTGKRTSFDLLGGLERYLSSAKNQIYHIDDIQTLRALRNYIADTYGQAHGLEGLDALSEEETQERIKEVYGAHLSTFAKFLNEEANVLAGKTALIDRGLEGIIGRRGITLLNELNKQVGSNAVGLNLSSALTNILPVVQTFAKSNKAAFVKAFAQTAAHKISGRSDGFAENSPVMIRRKGADRFYRTFWQKLSDIGYVPMGVVDSAATELIARTKYNELVSKGMDSQKAHIETDKWVSKLMGDRSLGQMPQLYNSKMLGLFTKFQLEVRNQLDAQFYDTIQEAKVSNEHIQDELERNAKTAAKVTSTFVQLFVLQNVFGKAFEAIAGYNPAFDIIEVLLTAFGFDDEEESEDTVGDNIGQAFLALLEDLPYTSAVLDGGRIPISSALPIGQVIKGEDQYGNEKPRWKTALEAAPYYLSPTGYGQAKKTVQGLKMFSKDHPIAGSYTKSGNLRFPVEDTVGNRIKAGVFGQYASKNAREYFDSGMSPLKEKQIQEFIDVDMPIRDYWDYREGLSKQEDLKDKFDYVAGLDLSVDQKNVLINNIVDRKEKVDMANYNDFGSYEEFDFYSKNKEKYEFLQESGITYKSYAYSVGETRKKYDDIYTWYKDNPEKVMVSKMVTDDIVQYREYTSALNDIKADKNANGKSIAGSAKAKKIAYINSLDIDYGAKIILFKSEYTSDDTYNYDIIEYLNSREDISYADMETILKELGFNVDANGNISWD